MQTETGLHKCADQAASRFLPLARLRLMTRRPALVDILFLNPWVRARLILLGWYVRFMTYVPYFPIYMHPRTGQYFLAESGIISIGIQRCQAAKPKMVTETRLNHSNYLAGGHHIGHRPRFNCWWLQ